MKTDRGQAAKSAAEGALIEGRNAVLEALRSATPISRVTIAEHVKSDRSIDEIARLAAEADVPVARATRQALDRLSERGAHQGVVAVVAPFRYASLPEVLHRTEGRESALLVALDHVVDPGNLGAVARSAEVAGASGLILPERRSAPVTAVAYKAAAGALSHLPVARVTNLVRALGVVKDAGFWVVGATERATQTVWDAPLEGRICLVLGSEGAGMSRLVEETCDLTVGLPVAGRVTSLNVAQAATAIMFEWVRRTSARS